MELNVECQSSELRQLVLAIDQSTQGTKAVLFASNGSVVAKVALPHKQIISDDGWVSHDVSEIYQNVLAAARMVCEKASVRPGEVKALGISNQRETCLAWDRKTGQPLAHAIVWQCGRAKDLCVEIAQQPGVSDKVRVLSGLELSPYFSASKMSWLLTHESSVQKSLQEKTLALGTIDSWLIYSLTKGKVFATEPSNACRTQLLDLYTASWSKELCQIFGVPEWTLPKVEDSNSCFGFTTMDGLFDEAIPIHGVLGDSQAALVAQNCVKSGDLKVTYGTGSSVMMQVGETPVTSERGLVSSIAWQLSGSRSYVLEGNLNYTGASISWLKDNLHLIEFPADVELLMKEANPTDTTYFVPAFTGLGAPWWDSEATALFTGMTRKTCRAELVSAVAQSIPLQISDVVIALGQDAHVEVNSIKVDGGVTKNRLIMQLQADLCGKSVVISDLQELSAAGVAFVAGQAVGVFKRNAIYDCLSHQIIEPAMKSDERDRKLYGWHQALRQARVHG